jgi:glucose/arabinose dehydrogenase
MRGLVLAALGAAILCFTGGCDDGGGAAPTAPSVPLLTLTFTPIVSGLAEPTAIAHAGDGSGRLFVVEQGGQVRILRDGVLSPTPFLNLSGRILSGGERGLLGLAFPPGYADKGYFYVDYTRTGDGATVVSRFRGTADADLADLASEEVLLVVPQPFSNHNGGQLAFGPDGMLYVALGDGGSGGDPQGNGQNPDSLLGKLLRLDVEGGSTPGGPPYRIPPDNPFVGDSAARDEIWATGLRNPWRFSFDRLTGDLYIADVGQGRMEEIDFQAAASPGGANYGWNLFEGPACFIPAVGCLPPARYEPPAAFYDHSLGCSVTGGYVYRGPSGNPGLQGLYIYGDFCSGRLWGLQRVGSVWENRVLTETPFSISTFGEDEAGRLYLADYGAGTLYRIDQP